MKKTFVALVLFAQALGAFAQAPEKFTVEVKEFDELKVVDGINVEYFCDPLKAGKVEFESTPQMASSIMFQPNGKGKLEVKLATRDTEYVNLPTVRVYSTYLTKVENDGDSTVKVMSLAAGPKFQAVLVGNGRLEVSGVSSARAEAKLATGKGVIVMSGKAETANLSLTGAGRIEAFELDATDVGVKLWGTGLVQCTVQKQLNVSGMGTGNVVYKGTPTIRDRAVKVNTKPFVAN